MSEQKSMTARIALQCKGSATLRRPDELEIVFNEGILWALEKTRAIIYAINEIDTELTLCLNHLKPFFRGGLPWPAESTTKGDFVVSYLWMHVQDESLRFEIWDARSSDKLHGFLKFADVPGLCEVIEQDRRFAVEDILMRLCKTLPKPPDASTQIALLVRALRLAEPWLVKLGDHIGNGTPEDPMGRCAALLAVRHALSVATGAAADGDGAGHH